MPEIKKHRLTKPQWAYCVLLAAMITYLFCFTDLVLSARETESFTDFAGAWRVDGEAFVDADRISAGQFGGAVTLVKMLPEGLDDNDALCFSSNNANLTVRIGDRQVYAFHSKKNLTGNGYGTAYHTVNLGALDAGEMVSIELSTVFSNGKGGRIGSLMICADEAYRHILLDAHMAEMVLSTLVMFSGIIITVICAVLYGRFSQPYHLAGLGIALLLTGLWSLGDTTMPQMMTGHLYAWRTVDYTALHLAIYPMVDFINSLTRQKRKIYPRLALIFSCADMMLLLILRVFFDRDMSHLTSVIYFDYILLLVLIAAILADNCIYCRRQGLQTGLGLFYLGLGGFMTCVVLDLIVFRLLVGTRMMSERGSFLRIGLSVFSAMMVMQTLVWWMNERNSINRDRFINRILQYAAPAGDAETSIHAMLEYIGTELHAKRTYIFENRNNEKFHCTYEWCAEGTEPHTGAWLDLPYHGLIDELYALFKRKNRLIIQDREVSRDLNSILYHVLLENGVERLVVGPLEADDALIGLFGVDDAPPEHLADVSEIIRLISYFFTQLVLHRNEQKQLVYYSYYDALTGCRNRRAMQEYEESGFRTDVPYGFVMCDVNGLKQINDNEGHEAGDAVIVGVAKCLREVFGEENVYRTGGDEFMAYSCRGDATAFDADVAKLRALLKEQGRSAAVGAVFRAHGGKDFRQLKEEADALMYQDKERYYQGRNDRRRR